jgi:polyhydroxyalkanoate synthesis regulator phasin
MAKSTLKSYIEAGAQFTEMPRQQAEVFVKGLVKSGDIRRRDAEQLLQTLLSRGRETTDRVAALVQAEVAKQMTALAERFDDIEGRVESMAASMRSSEAAGAPVPTSSSDTSTSAAPTPAAGDQPDLNQSAPPKAGVKKSAGKKSSAKSGAKKSGAKKSGAKKSGAKKSGAKKSGAKKSGAKKSAARPQGTSSSSDSVGSSGVRKVSTTRPSRSPE